MSLLLTIEPSANRARGTVMRVKDLAEASRAYAQVRDSTGEGASTFPEGEVVGDGKTYRVSYNAKVWNKGPWQSGDTPVYSPYTNA